VFARFPEGGKVKTRLIPALGPERAAALHAVLTRRTLDVTRRFCRDRLCDLEIQFAGGDVLRMQSQFGSENQYSTQHGADLGERLEHAVAMAFAAGTGRVMVIGTDCPEIEPARLEEAFARLSHSDLVLGPAIDGGYYLIGMQDHHAELFRGIDWGTEHVLRQTIEKARRSRLRVSQLPPLSDVDYPEDLLACRRVPGAFSEVLPETVSGLLSIVIPTFNEAAIIEQTLDRLAGLKNLEVIVADGGSTDGTIDLVRRRGIDVVPTRAGRGRQMNAGAALARGEVLLFLHADTSLPPQFQDQIGSILKSGAIAGAFPLSIDDTHPGLRWIEWAANLRSRSLQMPYGDQGLFLRSELFQRIGGFPNWPLMEDCELCRRLKRLGRIRLAPEPVRTSSRRWRKLGIWRTTLLNQMCVAGFHLGVSPERLARWYRSRRRRIP